MVSEFSRPGITLQSSSKHALLSKHHFAGFRVRYNLTSARRNVVAAERVNSAAREQKPVILVVDSSPAISGLMQELLSIRGYATNEATTVEDAAVMVRSQPPDLILLDPRIGAQSGLEFCRELKSNPLTELIAVVMLTGASDSSDRVHGIEAGADDFLVKPVLAEELIAVIKSQLRRKKAVERRLVSSEREGSNSEYDAFISHASEDKDEFVRPLAHHLKTAGVRTWYDEHELRIGDSLRESIDRGLGHSNYGIVVLSPHFFAKRWPQRELNGLSARENHGRKVILPVWFNLSFEDVEKAAPMLADRIAARSQDGIDTVVQRLVKVIRPDLLPENPI